jgi:hypothetical protein
MSREPSAGCSRGTSCQKSFSDGGGPHHRESVGRGVDAGKESHYWAHMLDASGTELLSCKLKNNEDDLSKSSSMMLSYWRKRSSGQWISPERALCVALGTAVGAKPEGALHFRPRCGHRARDTYRGESKTDARDAHVIAYPRPG